MIVVPMAVANKVTDTKVEAGEVKVGVEIRGMIETLGTALLVETKVEEIVLRADGEASQGSRVLGTQTLGLLLVQHPTLNLWWAVPPVAGGVKR